MLSIEHISGIISICCKFDAIWPLFDFEILGVKAYLQYLGRCLQLYKENTLFDLNLNLIPGSKVKSNMKIYFVWPKYLSIINTNLELIFNVYSVFFSYLCNFYKNYAIYQKIKYLFKYAICKLAKSHTVGIISFPTQYYGSFLNKFMG